MNRNRTAIALSDTRLVDARVSTHGMCRLAVLWIGLLVFSPGCMGPRWIFNDTWNDGEAMLPIFLDESATLPHWPVVEGEQSAAQDRLEKEKIVRLTEEEAERLAGEVPGNREAGTPYLVRAVYLFLEPGRFEVFYKNRELVVTHTSLGTDTAWRVKRYALIVRLKEHPTRVITECSIMV